MVQEDADEVNNTLIINTFWFVTGVDFWELGNLVTINLNSFYHEFEKTHFIMNLKPGYHKFFNFYTHVREKKTIRPF